MKMYNSPQVEVTILETLVGLMQAVSSDTPLGGIKNIPDDFEPA